MSTTPGKLKTFFRVILAILALEMIYNGLVGKLLTMPQSQWSDQEMEEKMGGLLRWGVIIASAGHAAGRRPLPDRELVRAN